MLHGRSAETARIDELLAAATHGRSGVLVIRGEAGVGKTALLDYAAAAAGMRVLRGTGIESEAELPFAALQLLLRPGLGRLDVLPPPQARALRGAFGLAGTPGEDRFLIGLAALSLLSELAGDGALLGLIDDAHWLDRASADALLFAARRLESEGVVLLLAAREDGFDAPGLPELSLGRLGRDASRALLAERAPGLPPGLADRVLAEADGNPLALLELPAALSGASGVPVALTASLELPAPLPLPRRLQQTYYRQVAALPASARTFLLVAAAEETGDLGLVRRAAHALGLPAASAGAAERSGLIVVDASAVAFRHPLVRAAVYQGATSAEREAVHAALATALDDPLAGELGADRRAWHRAAATAGPDEQVAAELEQAVGRARQRLGYAAAAAALERAARLTPDQPERARRLIAAAGAALDAGRPDAATALAGQGQRLTADPGALAEIARVRAWVAMDRGAMHRVHELVVAGAGPIAGSDPMSAASLLRLGAVAGWWAGDAKLVQDAADRMTGLGQSGLIPGSGALQAMADLLAGRSATAVPRLAEVVATVRRSQPEQLATSFYAANMALLIGDFDSARPDAVDRPGLPYPGGDPPPRTAVPGAGLRELLPDQVPRRHRGRDRGAAAGPGHRSAGARGRTVQHAGPARGGRRRRAAAALALFERTGARPWADRARAELRAAGEPAAAGAPAPDRLSLLTSQELQVVRLAASGATNRDIAGQLFLSPRTVSHHLYRAFPKLGVTNRTALARLDLTGPDNLP